MPSAPRYRRSVFLALALLALLAAGLGLSLGAVTLPLPVIGSTLGLPWLATPAEHEALIVQHLRAPRVLLGLLVGAALAISGAALQGLFRNPLAEPSLLGVSSGAALSAVLVLVLLPGLPLVPAAFLGGAAATLLVMRLSRVDGSLRITTLLLAGLALNALAGAGIAFLVFLADDQALRSVTFWLFGSLGRVGWQELAWIAPLLLLPIVMLPRRARALDALQLGEAQAGHLGVRVERLKRELTLWVVLATATSVAATGIIGFVGFVVPHLVRLVAGPNHRLLLPASALLGASLLVLADVAARTLSPPSELPIGVLTALIGAPFFLALLAQGRQRMDLQ